MLAARACDDELPASIPPEERNTAPGTDDLLSVDRTLWEEGKDGEREMKRASPLRNKQKGGH